MIFSIHAGLAISLLLSSLSSLGQAAALKPTNTHLVGFTTQKKELEQFKAPIKGTIPSWLRGKFLSIGPAIFELGNSKASHWFDGFGMIHQFSIAPDSVTYTNKIINSEYYQDCCKQKKIKGSAPEQKKSTWSKLTSALSTDTKRPIYDNTNVNIAHFNNKLVCLTETPKPIEVDCNTLATKSHVEFQDPCEAHFSSAHPIIDPITKEWYWLAIQFAHNSSYLIYKMAPQGTKRTLVSSLTVGYPAYIHSFALTPNYIIITESPYTVSPYDLLLSDTSYIENFNWKPKNPTQFLIIDRKTGKLLTTLKTDAFFTLHHLNAVEKDNRIYLDLVAYKDPSILKAFYFNLLAKQEIPQAYLKRYTLDLKTHAVTSTLLSDLPLELPHINPTKYNKDYRYIYATSSPDNLHQKLVKLDLETKKVLTWQCDNCFPSEPIFVANPTGTAEDDGVIISHVLNGTTKTSFLLILDAKTFKEIARAQLPQHIPFTVHSAFIK